MSTVSRPPSQFNMVAYAEALIIGPPRPLDFDEQFGDGPHAGGHMDEATARQHDPEAIPFGNGHAPADVAEMAQGLADYAIDQAIQAADEANAGEMRKAIAGAKHLLGCAKIRLQRQQEIGTDGGTVSYACFVEGPQYALHIGTGPTPTEAVERCIHVIDEKFLTRIAQGWRVNGLAIVLAGDFRSEDEAMGIARRIALDVVYLDSCIEFNVPGVSGGDRTPQAASAVAA